MSFTINLKRFNFDQRRNDIKYEMAFQKGIHGEINLDGEKRIITEKIPVDIFAKNKTLELQNEF